MNGHTQEATTGRYDEGSLEPKIEQGVEKSDAPQSEDPPHWQEALRDRTYDALIGQWMVINDRKVLIDDVVEGRLLAASCSCWASSPAIWSNVDVLAYPTFNLQVPLLTGFLDEPRRVSGVV